jgi:hypothetical protein
MTVAGPEVQPVFVVGMNGSGTTMLLDNLGRHPSLYAFPRETRLIPFLIASQQRFGDLDKDDNYRRLWEEVLAINVFEYVNGHKPVPLPENWRDRPRGLASVLDGVFRYFAAREGKQRWCEKTPQHVQHMDKLSELFPKARFIHVIRDGRDSAASFSRRWSRTPELTIYRWKKVVALGRKQGRTLGGERYLEVRFEDLTTEPETWLRKICEFVDVPFDDAVLVSSQPYLNAATRRLDQEQKSGGLQPNSGNWKTCFTKSRQRSLERIAGRTLASCGYETDAPEADRDPPAWQRRYWSARDYTLQYLKEIGLKLTGRIERPWRVILSRPIVAFRQRGENKY